MRFTGERFAIAYTERRAPGTPGEERYATFVQMLDRAGRPLGDPREVEPVAAHSGQNAMATIDDQFAVFALKFDESTLQATASSFVVLDQDGDAVIGPVAPFVGRPEEGTHLTTMIGMDYDGEGLGLAWHSTSFTFGDSIFFMRWQPDGETLVPPSWVANGIARTSGMAWMGSNYLIPFSVAQRVSYLARISDRGAVEGVIEIATPGQSASYVLRTAKTPEQLLVNGAFVPAGSILRTDRQGDPLGPMTNGPPEARALAVRGDGPIGLIELIGTADRHAFLDFFYAGCAGE
jgi:hypothetical protein